MTAQILIDFLFLIILVCHIVKIKHLQDENRELKEHLQVAEKYIGKNQDHIENVLDMVKVLLDEMKWVKIEMIETIEKIEKAEKAE